jgi:uncharacterized membrane protein
MPNLAPLFPVILTTHIALAISLLIPSLLLPFTLRGRRTSETNGRIVRVLLWLQSNGTVIIGIGLAATGVAMIAVLGSRMLEQPWLLAAVAVYAIVLGVAYVIQRPNLRRLVDRSGVTDDAAERRWRDRARRQRYVAYAMAAAVGLIAFLMSTKPTLW